MLAMQSSNLPSNVNSAVGSSYGDMSRSRGSAEIHSRSVEPSAGAALPRQEENAQEKLRRLMDLPATDDLEWTRQDR